MLHCQLCRLLLNAWILYARGLSGHTSLHGHRRLCRGLLAPRCSVIASDAGDSSLLGARTSPAMLETPRSLVLGHRQRRRGLPCCSDLAMSRRCAIKLLHAVRIRVLILDSTSRVLIHACRTMSANLLDLFFFDPTIRFILHLLAGSGTKWAHFTLR